MTQSEAQPQKASFAFKAGRSGCADGMKVDFLSNPPLYRVGRRISASTRFDNDRIFAGAHAKPNTVGRVIRLCLGLGVTPVFAVPREHGPQSMIESYNGRWQAKVWQRFEHRSLAGLTDQSRRFVDACRVRSASRIEAAPQRQTFPHPWKMDLRVPLRGVLVFLRRTTPSGGAAVLGRDYDVSRQWCNRMVRAEVDFDRQQIRFYALRRSAPPGQPLPKSAAYQPPDWEFHE